MTRKLVIAAQKLIEDVKSRHPGEDLYCPFMKAVEEALPNEKTRHCYIGAPEAYALDHVAYTVTKAFGETCYLVGSATEHRNFRDVDVRMIFDDAKWIALFGDGAASHTFFWSLLTVSISEYMSKRTGLKVDFQIQRRKNVKQSDWDKIRTPIGMFYSDDTLPAWRKDLEPE